MELPFIVYSILKQCWSVGYVNLLTLSFIYNMYFTHYSYYKNKGYVWRVIKTNPRLKNSTTHPGFEIPGSTTEILLIKSNFRCLFQKEVWHIMQLSHSPLIIANSCIPIQRMISGGCTVRRWKRMELLRRKAQMKMK